MQEHRVGKRNDIAARLRRADLRPPEHDVRKAILTAFAHDGTALSVEALAQVWFVSYHGGFPPDNMARIPPKSL